MPTYPNPGTFVDGSTSVPVSATNLNNMKSALLQAVQADGTGPTTTAVVKLGNGFPLQNGSDANDNIGFGLDGSTVVGVESFNHSTSIISGISLFNKFNTYYDGSNDRFINGISAAYELVLDGSGVRVRKSTNSPSAGAVITWGAFTVLFS